MKKVLGILAIALVSISAIAQEENSSYAFSLQEAVSYALENNKNLENARLEVEKSEKGIWEAISQGLPQVDATFDYMTYFDYELAFSFGGDFNYTQEQIDAATNTVLGRPPYSLVGLTPTDLLPHYAAGEIENELAGPDAGTILMSDQMTAALQVGQLIFSGQYIAGIQTAKLAHKISEQALNNSEIDTKEAVITSYYLTLISEASLEMIRRNLSNLKKMKDQTQIMYETGMAEQLDVDQFQVTVNQLENTIKSMERNLQLNYNMLRFTLGLPADTKIELNNELSDLFDEMSMAKLLLLDFNKEENISYQIMNSQAAITKKMWDMEKWSYAPTIAGFYNRNLKLRTTGFDMTPENLAGFNLSVPIFHSGQRSSNIAQAKLDYEISKRNAEILGDQLKIQESQLKFNLQSSLDNYYSQLENVELAQRVLDNYKRKFENGMASSLEVTQSNSSYLEAESNYLSAMFDVMNARIALEKLMNNLNNL